MGDSILQFQKMLTRILKTTFQVMLKIAMVILSIIAIRFLGVKGMLGLLIGFTGVSYLILSGNKTFYTIINMFDMDRRNEYEKEITTAERNHATVKFGK